MTAAAANVRHLQAPSADAAEPADAHVIKTENEAIEVAHRTAEVLAAEASDRDRDRVLPFREIELFSRSGLWGITVPKEYGGAGASHVTLARVVDIISEADPSLGQIPQNHYCVVDGIRVTGTEKQKRFFFGEVLKGRRFGNAFSESGSKTVLDIETRVRRVGQSHVLSGRKFYTTGALFAHWVPVWALNDDDKGVLVIVPRNASGLNVINDWTGFGQRTTASGTVDLNDVLVAEDHIVNFYTAYDEPTTAGPLAQIIQVAVDLGIARAAIKDTIKFVNQYSRPWADSKLEKATQDPFTIAQIGDLQIKLHAAEALTERAGAAIDAAVPSPDEENVAVASVAVAEAKVLTTEIAILATNKLHELAGTKSTLGKYNLDRHWRNARTHTLHDPVRWKYFAVGNYVLNGIKPPRHAWI